VTKHIQVIVNPAAGQPEPILRLLNEVFQAADAKWNVSITQEQGDGAKLARQAADAGADIVAVYGGDGTVMEVVNGLMGSGATLGILPGGTGNVFAVELGISQDTAQAARLLVDPESQTRKVDVGQCGEHHFLLRVGIGFTAKRINLTSRELRDKYGRLAYFIAALKAVPESRAVRYNLSLDGKHVECEGFTCLVENAGNLGIAGVSLASDVSIKDGLLDVFVIRDLNLDSITSLAASVVGENSPQADFHHWQAAEIQVESQPSQPVVVDGESWGDTPTTIQVLPQAIQVIVGSS
jgi:YegS/Rv2252/BmrU family lipid kinase